MLCSLPKMLYKTHLLYQPLISPFMPDCQSSGFFPTFWAFEAGLLNEVNPSSFFLPPIFQWQKKICQKTTKSFLILFCSRLLSFWSFPWLIHGRKPETVETESIKTKNPRTENTFCGILQRITTILWRTWSL